MEAFKGRILLWLLSNPVPLPPEETRYAMAFKRLLPLLSRSGSASTTPAAFAPAEELQPEIHTALTLKGETGLFGKPDLLFAIFLILHFLIWSFLPLAVMPNLPLDVIEGLLWGHEWQLGYNKHPPLQAWLLEGVAVLFDRHPAGIFLLAQTSIILTFWAVWRLALRLLGDKWLALAAVLVLNSVYYFNYPAPEFNPNVLQMPIWALIAWRLHAAVKDDRLSDWILCGFLAGLGILTKYFTGVLLVPLMLFILAHPLARTRLARPGPWICIAIGLLVIGPHLYWLATGPALSLEYAARRTERAEFWWQHLVFPLQFLLSQLPLLPGVLGLPWLLRDLPAIRAGLARTGEKFSGYGGTHRWPGLAGLSRLDSFDRGWLLTIAFGPFLVCVLAGLVAGVGTEPMWGVPMWSFLGIFVLAVLAPSIPSPPVRRRARTFGLACMAFFVLAIVAFAGVHFLEPAFKKKKAKRSHFPGAPLALLVSDKWQEETGQPLRYVAGTIWLAGNVGFYAPDRPSVFIEGTYDADNPWIDREDLNCQGAMLVWYGKQFGEALPEALRDHFPRAEALPMLSLDWQTPFEVDPMLIGWAIQRPLPECGGKAPDPEPTHTKPAQTKPEDATPDEGQPGAEPSAEAGPADDLPAPELQMTPEPPEPSGSAGSAGSASIQSETALPDAEAETAPEMPAAEEGHQDPVAPEAPRFDTPEDGEEQTLPSDPAPDEPAEGSTAPEEIRRKPLPAL